MAQPRRGRGKRVVAHRRTAHSGRAVGRSNMTVADLQAVLVHVTEGVLSSGPQTAEGLVLMYFPSQVASEFDGLRQPNWVVIDASQSIDDIHKQVREDMGSVRRSNGVAGLRGWCT